MKSSIRLLTLLVAASSLACATASHAELVATPLPGDTRLVQFEYDADNTYLLLARPKSVTHIEFGRDEQIVTLAGGDTKNWELTPTQNRRSHFVKPVYDQLETSMTVITDKRSYQFVLRSTGPGAKWYQRVTWRYGEMIMLDLKAAEDRAVEDQRPVPRLRVQECRTWAPVWIPGASIWVPDRGEMPFRPTSVFDDGGLLDTNSPGHKSFALFAVGDGGELMSTMSSGYPLHSGF
jgi:type IV secretion system protein VirB9